MKIDTFSLDGQMLRCFTIEGHTQFAAADVFQAIKSGNHRIALRSLNAMDKGAQNVQARGGPKINLPTHLDSLSMY